MKEVIETQGTHTSRNEVITCSRCGERCGDSAEADSSYDVLHAEIEFHSGRKVKVEFDGAPAKMLVTNIAKVTMEHEEGTSYPEGRNTVVQVVDSCAKCFLEAALPALLAAGFSVREEDKSW